MLLINDILEDNPLYMQSGCWFIESNCTLGIILYMQLVSDKISDKVNVRDCHTIVRPDVDGVNLHQVRERYDEKLRIQSGRDPWFGCLSKKEEFC